MSVTRDIQIYAYIASCLAEEALITPDEKVRFLEILRKESAAWR